MNHTERQKTILRLCAEGPVTRRLSRQEGMGGYSVVIKAVGKGYPLRIGLGAYRELEDAGYIQTDDRGRVCLLPAGRAAAEQLKGGK